MREYTIVLTPDLHDGGYTVTVPALPGCFTQGDTEEEAIDNAREAIRCHVEGLRLDGQPLPERDVTPRIVSIDVPDPAAA